MSILDALAHLPDDAAVTVTLRVSELREALSARSPLRLLTTGQAASELGYSGDTWRSWAEAGKIEGAYRDEGDDGMWRLPLGACEDHLERLRSGTLNRRRKRGPWKAKASTAQAGGAGPEGDMEGPVGVLRFAPVGRRKADDEELWDAGGDLHLHVDGNRLDALKGHGLHPRHHAPSPGSPTPRKI